MKPAVLSDTSKSAKSIAQKIAKQIAEEPLEILKDAKTQIAGEQVSVRQENPNPIKQNGENPQIAEQQKMKDKVFAERRMQALQNEVNDIRKLETFKDLQAKITGGEDVFLEDYPELSMEQKQVLKAQMEAVKIQRQQESYQAGVNEVPSIHSKPSRRFGAGQKHEAEKQQTRVEKPVPPSG